MLVRALAAALALAAASSASAASTTASTTSTTSTSASTASTSTSSASGDSSATTGSVSCVFRYSMPTASNVPSEVAAKAAATDSASASGSEATSGSAAASASAGDGSAATAGTVHTPDGSDSSATSDAGDGSSGSGSSSATTTPSSTTRTPSTTTATPSSTTKTPSTTTATPSSTTKTPSTTTAAPSTSSASSSGSSGDARFRRLVADAGAATTRTSTLSSNATESASASASGSSDSSSGSSAASTTTTTTTPSTSTSSNSTSSTTTTTTSSSSSSLSSSSSSSSSSSTTTTIEFMCDETFYSAWSTMGLVCGASELDTAKAAAQTQCLIYAGTADGTGITDLTTCVSLCRFPACNNGTWDYTADDGINSDVYADLDLLSLLSAAGESAAADGAVTQPFSNLTMTTTSQCDYTSDSSFSACQCDNYVVSSASSSSAAGGTTASGTGADYTVPEDKGLADSDHWADGTTKTTVDKAGIASTSIGTSAATVSVLAGGAMTVASGAVSGVSAAASVGVTLAAVELCQFGVMINQMNVDARPRFLENMGKKFSASSFQFLPFGKTSSSSSNSSSSSSSSGSYSASGSSSASAAGRRDRRLGSASASGSTSTSSSASGSGSSSSTSSVQGMEKYAELIGVQADMLFYLTVAGVGCLIGALFLSYAAAMGICSFFVSDFPAFRKKWLDKAIGVLMMILILSEYAIGATAMYQICYCIDNGSIDASFVLAVVALLVMAFGTILFGIMVIRNNEEELRDLGTKRHFDKKFHARFGPLYDEYSFEGRFFFAPKLILSLLCGMTTGMVWIEGLWQIVALIGLHIAFLFYLEMKQPYPTAFVQKTSSFVIIIKISALFLSFFLLSSATSFNEDIPDDLREGVGFAIVGLQVLVLVALMIRQVYIFYRTWKLKRDGASSEEEDDKAGTTVVTSSNRDGASDPFFSLGEPNRAYQQQQQQQQQVTTTTSYRENSVAMLGDDAYGFQQQQQPPAPQQPLRGLQPPTGRRTASVVVHDGPGGYRSNEVSL